MTSDLHIWPQKVQRTDSTATISAIVESQKLDKKVLWFRNQKVLWFRIPLENLPSATELADPFVTAMIFLAMRNATNLRIHGSVSRSLIRNLDEFQVAWNCWRPHRYHPVKVIADEEIEHNSQISDIAIAAFSGGLDSSFTVWRHTKGDCGRLKQNLKAAVMVHGFDIPLHQTDVFARAAENSRTMVKSVGLDFIPMACNFRELGHDWEEEHGAALASCLSLFSKDFSTGLVASSHVYNQLLFPWGSNPLTDPMLSSNSFSIVHDAAGVHRIKKAEGVSKWQECMSHLRVCWQGEQKDRNCGGCQRCIATGLCFAAVDVNPPACLNTPSLDEGIRILKKLTIKPIAVTRLEEIMEMAKKNRIRATWVSALNELIIFKTIRNKTKSNKKNHIKFLRRGLEAISKMRKTKLT